MDESLKFYEEMVGLTVTRRFSPRENLDVAFLGNGETEIELLCDGLYPQTDAVTRAALDTMSIGFILDLPLEAMREKLIAAGHTEMSPILSPSPTIRFFYVHDPNGFKVQFVEG